MYKAFYDRLPENIFNSENILVTQIYPTFKRFNYEYIVRFYAENLLLIEMIDKEHRMSHEVIFTYGTLDRDLLFDKMMIDVKMWTSTSPSTAEILLLKSIDQPQFEYEESV